MNSLFAGVDIGSTNSKACVIDVEGNILGYAQDATGVDRGSSGEEVLVAACSKLGVSVDDLTCIGATGYGRRQLGCADVVYPEVICHARGAEHLVPGTRTVLDIGGQDCKIIECKDGSVLKFEMNDKCAAGTGRFFEVLSEHLFNVSIDELSDLAAASTNGARVSSMCTVFAETEIVSMLSQGVSEADICRGMIEAIFRRIKAMAGAASIRIVSPVVFMGGCARCAAAKPILEEMIGMEVLVPEVPQMPASLGIALIARDDYLLDSQDNNQD
jgi:predicted CoA-substrate-specific enzyme activase